MAEGWAKALKGDEIEAFSAGTAPQGVNPHAVAVMAEKGVDISAYTSNHLEDFSDIEFDYVVTVCSSADKKCPRFPRHTKKIHIGFDDPPKLARDTSSANDALVHYRRVRDEIRDYIMTLPDSLD
jgi:arsenate reductase (thioredoxin)